MAIKKRKKPDTITNGGAVQYRPSPKEQVESLQRQLQHAESRTDIETVATNAAGLVEHIGNLRRDIATHEHIVKELKDSHNTALLQHQLTVAKFKELSAVPQPTA